MADSTPAFSAQEISELAQANANLFLFSTLAFLKEHDIPIHEWTSFLQIRLASRWEGRQSFKAHDIATLVGKNLLSGGATLLRLDGNDNHAEVELAWEGLRQYIKAFPPLTHDDFVPMLDFYATLTKRMGYHYHCAWEEPRIHITITKKGSVADPSQAPEQ